MKIKNAIAIICLAITLTAGCTEKTNDISETSEIYIMADNIQTPTETSSAITFEVITAYEDFDPPALCFEPWGADYGDLPDGSEELFKKALNVWCLYNINSMLCDENTAETITLPIDNASYVYYRTGISYEGFRSYLESIFTKDWIDNFQKTNSTFINNYDELLCLNVGGVINEDFVSVTFNITEKTKDAVTFVGAAKYEADDGYTYEKEFSEEMVMVDGEWRFSEFNCWY